MKTPAANTAETTCKTIRRLSNALPQVSCSEFGIPSTQQFFLSLYIMCAFERTGLARGGRLASSLRLKEEQLASTVKINLCALAELLGAPFLVESAFLADDIPLQKPLAELHHLAESGDAVTIGLVYEKLLERTAAKQQGIFYTPQPLARRIARQALKNLVIGRSPQQLLELKILDPACGTGAFLIEALLFIADVITPSTSVDAHLLCTAAEHCIFGIDRDPDAAQLTKIAIALLCLSADQGSLLPKPQLPNLTSNIRTGNSLLSLSDFDMRKPTEQALAEQLKAFEWSAGFPSICPQPGFNCIIGNPPYGLSRDQQINEAENEKLQQVYDSWRAGKINKYMAFMARGWELLAGGGVLSYVVPNAWLGIKSAVRMRRNLLEQRALKRIEIFHLPLFEDPVVEAVIFQAIKGNKSASFEIAHFYDAPKGIDQAQPGQIFRMPISVSLKTPGTTIPTNWNARTSDIFESITSSSFRLGDASSPFLPRISMQAYATGKGVPPQSKEDVKNHIYHCSTDRDESAHPYLEGQDVRRYHVLWSGRYLRYGEWLAEPQKLSYFSGPRIALREILGRSPYLICASFLRETALYNKSVLNILPRYGCPEEDLLALLAILNSKLASFVVRFVGRKTQRTIFPKIVNEDLQDFPLPLNFRDNVQSLAAIVNDMRNYFGMSIERDLLKLSSGNGHPTTEDLTLQAQLDRAVYKAYALPEDIISDLEAAVAESVVK